MMAVAALLATSSSITANMYGAAGLTSKLAGTRQFPPVFGSRAIVGGTRGLTITALIIIVLANLVDLTAIASLGSVVALVIFIMVALAGMRLRTETGSRGWVIVTAILVTAIVLAIFLFQTLRTEPQTFVAMVGVLALSVALEFLWSGIRRRRDAAASPSGV
jgi:lysylphosphatidylglycerol synthetase-like protein (DUF2156 family)